MFFTKLSILRLVFFAFTVFLLGQNTIQYTFAQSCPQPEDTFVNLSKWKNTGSTPNQIAVQTFNGKQALKHNYTDINSYLFSTHTLCSGFFGSIMVDFYDDGDSTKGTLFSVYSGDVASQPSSQMEMIGLGVWTTVDANTYAYRITNSGDPAAATISSGVTRSIGWHTLELIVTQEGAYGAIDGKSLAWITPNSLNTHSQFKSQGARSIGIVSTWGLGSTNYYARLRSRPLQPLNQTFGFMFSGSVQPPHLYPETFSELSSNWSSSYAPSYEVLDVIGMTTFPPLATKNQQGGNWHVVNITCCGHTGKNGTTQINITPWTKPTMFNVYSRSRLQDFVNQNGLGAYYSIGSEPNVLVPGSTSFYTYILQFDFGNNTYWDLTKYWGWKINNGGTVAYDSNEGTQGEQSMKITSTSGQNWMSSLELPNIRPNKRYRVKVDIKTNNVQASAGQGAGLHIYENEAWPGTAAGGGKTTMLTGTNDWNTYTFDFTTQSTTNQAKILIGMGFGGAAIGTAWFDNISFSPINSDGTVVADTLILNSNTGKRYSAIFEYYKRILKELDPSATIVGPNFLTFSPLPPGAKGPHEGAYGPYMPGRIWFDEFIAEHTARYGTKPLFDIYATHIYDNVRPWNRDSYIQYAKDTADDFRSYITHNYGADAKVWISEFGVQTPNVSDSESAAFMKEMNSYLTNRGDIEKWFWAWTYGVPNPFSGFLYTGNKSTDSLTAVGQQFKQLSIIHAGLTGGRKNPVDDNYDGHIEKSEWNIFMTRFYDTSVSLDTDNNNIINSIDFAKGKQLPLR